MPAGLAAGSRLVLRNSSGVSRGIVHRNITGRLQLYRNVKVCNNRAWLSSGTKTDDNPKEASKSNTNETSGIWERMGWKGGKEGILGSLLGMSKEDKEDEGQKEETVKLSRLFELAAAEKRLVGIALSAQLISSVATMSFPMALGKIVDTVQVAGGESNFEQLVMFLGGVFTLSAVAVAVRVSALEIAGSRVSRSLRKSLFLGMLKQETGFFDVNQSGELVNRLSADASSVSRTLTENIAKLLRSSIVTTASLGCVVYISPSLSLIALSVFPPIFICGTVFNTFLKRYSRKLLDALAGATQVASERLGSIRTVRLYGAEPFEYKRYSAAIDKTYGTAVRLSLAQAASSSLFFYSAQLALLAVLYNGGAAVASGALTVGSLTSFCMYAVNLGISSSSAATAVAHLARAQGAAARMMQVLDRIPQDDSSTIPSVSQHFGDKRLSKISTEQSLVNVLPEQRRDRPCIDFRNVGFSYPTRDSSEVLKGLNLSVYPGEILAVCGTSGCGKSSLANVLLRMYPHQGNVMFRGVPIESIPVSLLRQKIAVVPQEPILFDGTIRENIAYAQDAADKEAIEQAAVDADAHNMIQQFAAGYDTRVGERGVGLSGGERGRVAIARALLRRPIALILDESTAAMDAESEARVTEAIARVAKRDGIAVLAIAHRVSILRRADRIAVMKGGRIEEIGRFDELVARKGSLFHNIVRASENNDAEPYEQIAQER